jgi:threonine/homoserine/homoserine lactone efflux protein
MSSVDIEFGVTCLAAMLLPTTLTFSVLALVLAKRPERTGAWFFLGAFGLTMICGILAAIVLGDAAAAPKKSAEPRTWVAIFDVVAGALLLLFVIRMLRRPRNLRSERAAMNKMSKVASSPAIAIVAAGAALANPGPFIPIALKEVSQLKPSIAGYALIWTGFALISLLPLLVALVALAVSRERTTATLKRARAWLERHARTLGAVLIILVAVALLRNGIAGLMS